MFPCYHYMAIYSTLFLMMFRAIPHIFWLKETFKQRLHLNYYGYFFAFATMTSSITLNLVLKCIQGLDCKFDQQYFVSILYTAFTQSITWIFQLLKFVTLNEWKSFLTVVNLTFIVNKVHINHQFKCIFIQYSSIHWNLINIPSALKMKNLPSVVRDAHAIEKKYIKTIYISIIHSTIFA